MKKKLAGKISIVYIYIVFLIILVIATTIVLSGAERAAHSIRDMQQITEDYAQGQDAINTLMEASDYLTKEARVFVVTGHVEDAELYEEEVSITKRREKSLETFKSFKVKERTYGSLEKALNESNELTYTERHAMLLAAEGYGIDQKIYKTFTYDEKLNDKERAMSDQEKISESINIMFGADYDKEKSDIKEDVADSLNELMNELKERQVRSYDVAIALADYERNLDIIVLVSVFIMLGLTAILVIMPMRKSTKNIAAHEPLDPQGSKEFYCLAEAYNEMLEKSRQHQEQLSYEATHDELTGLYNRKMFEDKKEAFESEQTAMLIMDVDHFKEVNDTYGHEIGDKVLKKVADSLAGSFRLEDYVCRIGGDEFAVIMREMDPSLKEVVRSKISSVQEKMAVSDDLPRATLSIGVAFSEDIGPEENLFKKADKALYSIKEHGRDGYAFYCDM